jgi:hypothetical protein
MCLCLAILPLAQAASSPGAEPMVTSLPGSESPPDVLTLQRVQSGCALYCPSGYPIMRGSSCCRTPRAAHDCVAPRRNCAFGPARSGSGTGIKWGGPGAKCPPPVVQRSDACRSYPPGCPCSYNPP